MFLRRFPLTAPSYSDREAQDPRQTNGPFYEEDQPDRIANISGERRFSYTDFSACSSAALFRKYFGKNVYGECFLPANQCR